jgi:hypothetical protein
MIIFNQSIEIMYVMFHNKSDSIILYNQSLDTIQFILNKYFGTLIPGHYVEIPTFFSNPTFSNASNLRHYRFSTPPPPPPRWASSVWETLTLAKGVSLDPLQQRSIIEGIVHNIYFCRNNFLNCRINIVGFRNQ